MVPLFVEIVVAGVKLILVELDPVKTVTFPLFEAVFPYNKRWREPHVGVGRKFVQSEAAATKLQPYIEIGTVEVTPITFPD